MQGKDREDKLKRLDHIYLAVLSRNGGFSLFSGRFVNLTFLEIII